VNANTVIAAQQMMMRRARHFMVDLSLLGYL